MLPAERAPLELPHCCAPDLTVEPPSAQTAQKSARRTLASFFLVVPRLVGSWPARGATHRFACGTQDTKRNSTRTHNPSLRGSTLPAGKACKGVGIRAKAGVGG